MDTAEKRILICQSRACRKAGAAKVLAAFQATALPEVEVVASGCLGQCGNGSMVLVLPEEIWYWQIAPADVPAIVHHHILNGSAIDSLLYPRYHSQMHQD